MCVFVRRAGLSRPTRFAASAAIAVLAMAAGACTDTPTSPSGSAPFTRTDLRAGSGDGAATGNLVSVHYTGWLFDESRASQKGTQFDSSRGGDPFIFALGLGQVIAGWDQGLVGLQVGSIRRLVIPPSLAYGGVRNGPIPPHATLVFEIELLALQ